MTGKRTNCCRHTAEMRGRLASVSLLSTTFTTIHKVTSRSVSDPRAWPETNRRWAAMSEAEQNAWHTRAAAKRALVKLEPPKSRKRRSLRCVAVLSFGLSAFAMVFRFDRHGGGKCRAWSDLAWLRRVFSRPYFLVKIMVPVHAHQSQ